MKQSTKTRSTRLFAGAIIPFSIAIGLLIGVACRPAETQIENPYAGVE
jgi:hypothetical protein